jgi:hypothetical protein
MNQKMKNTPESFDRLIKSKLDEVEVDPSLADAYWQQMSLSKTKPTGTNKFRRYYWFSASILLIMLVIFAVIKRDRSITNNTNTKTIQQHSKVTPTNPYDTVTKADKKQIAISSTTTKSQVIKESSLKKFKSKTVFTNNQSQNKPTDDSVMNYQTTATLNSMNESQKDNSLSISKEAVQQTGIQQANTDLKKTDSVIKKPEAKKKAPYIIW